MNHRRFSISSLLFIICVTTQAQPSAATVDTFIKTKGQQFISESAVGLSIGIYDNGKTSFYNFGTIEKGGAETPDQHTDYEIGSITKTFTSLILAKAVQDKKVNLEDDVGKYLPEPYPNLQYNGVPLRLKHLASFSSNLPDNLPDMKTLFETTTRDSLPSAILKANQHYTKQNFFADLHQVHPDTLPGLLYKHSNAAAQLLGYIMENVYQLSYDQLLKNIITIPYQMPSTFLLPAKGPSGKVAKGYNSKRNAMPYLTVSEAKFAGGLLSCTSDLVNYMKMQLNEKDPLIRLSHTAVWKDVYNNDLGLSWIMSKDSSGRRQLFQSGGSFGFNSFMSLYPDAMIGVVLLTNTSDATMEKKLSIIADEICDTLTKK